MCKKSSFVYKENEELINRVICIVFILCFFNDILINRYKLLLLIWLLYYYNIVFKVKVDE